MRPVVYSRDISVINQTNGIEHLTGAPGRGGLSASLGSFSEEIGREEEGQIRRKPIYSFRVVGRYADSASRDGNKIVYILFL